MVARVNRRCLNREASVFLGVRSKYILEILGHFFVVPSFAVDINELRVLSEKCHQILSTARLQSRQEIFQYFQYRRGRLPETYRQQLFCKLFSQLLGVQTSRPRDLSSQRTFYSQ